MTQHSSCWWLDLLKEELNSFPSHCYVKNLIQASLFLKNRSNVLWAKSNKSSSYSLSLGSSFVIKSEVDWIVRVIILHFLDRRIHFFFNPLWVTVGNWFNIFYSPSSWKFMWIRMAHGSSITATAPSLRSPCFQSSSQARYYQRITCCFWTNSVSVSEQRVRFQIFSLSLQIPAWSPSISISL